ncbi:MAG: cohesin domain-containing protein, partial [bacterium]|nr:cohesin domain-containing protein [bacterium]
LTIQLERVIVADKDGRTNALDLLGWKISLNTQGGTSGGGGGTGDGGDPSTTDKFSLDLNAEAGNQGVMTLGSVVAGQRVEVQLYGTDLTNLKQYTFDLEYNAAHLSPVDGTQGVLTEGFVAPGLDLTVPAVVTFGGATFGSEIAGSGHLATVVFEVLPGLVDAGKTTIRLAKVGYGLSFAELTFFTPDQTIAIQTAKLDVSGGGDGGTGGDGGGSVTPSAGDGTWTLDLDATIGDQAVRELTVAAGKEFTVEFINNQGVTNSLGGQLNFEFDPTKVEPVSGSIKGIAALLGSAAIEGNTIRFTLASLGGVSVDQGHIGEIKFKTAASFTGETTITLVSASIGNADNFEQTPSEPNVSVVIREGVATVVANPDFDGDGEIGFRDFVAFAQRYGSKSADPLYDAKLDLDSNGEIGFRDFVMFAQVYGKPASAFVAPGQ